MFHRRSFIGIRLNLSVLAMFFISICCFFSSTSSAKAPEQQIHLTAGFEPSALSGSVGWVPHWTLGKSDRFRLGAGLRLSYFQGKALRLETAEYDAISRNETSIVSDVSPQILALNATISAQYYPLDWLSFGFNLDLIGQSFGPDGDASYAEDGFAAKQSLHPTRTNLFLVALRDIGTLNSEFYVATPLNDRWSVRLGLSHFFAEMTSEVPLKHGGERFRTIRDLVFISVAHTLQ